MTQVVECMPNKHRALNPYPSTTKKNVQIPFLTFFFLLQLPNSYHLSLLYLEKIVQNLCASITFSLQIFSTNDKLRQSAHTHNTKRHSVPTVWGSWKVYVHVTENAMEIQLCSLWALQSTLPLSGLEEEKMNRNCWMLSHFSKGKYKAHFLTWVTKSLLQSPVSFHSLKVYSNV
jgi:hypothetical protein